MLCVIIHVLTFTVFLTPSRTLQNQIHHEPFLFFPLVFFSPLLTLCHVVFLFFLCVFVCVDVWVRFRE